VRTQFGRYRRAAPPAPAAKIKILQPLSVDSDSSVSLAAIKALSGYGAAAVSILSEILSQDDTEPVRLAALEAMKKIGLLCVSPVAGALTCH
jgi:HEAT repeat protein